MLKRKSFRNSHQKCHINRLALTICRQCHVLEAVLICCARARQLSGSGDGALAVDDDALINAQIFTVDVLHFQTEFVRIRRGDGRRFVFGL